VIRDQVQAWKQHTPLIAAQNEHSHFQVSHSHLSEYAVVGFEYGYALANPNSLIMFEAPYGDIANGAQIVIDCFMASGEVKWGVENGIVMLMPHGIDGEGPEHSSCRLERFLQLSGEDPTRIAETEKAHRELGNIQVCVPTTPANYFHMLRRQMRRDFRKPLILATPKKKLHHPLMKSNIADFSEKNRVSRMINEVDDRVIAAKEGVKKVLITCGSFYYDLYEDRERRWADRDMSDVAIVRLEQITPFPFDRLEH
jgi:2-oxoglutarate dehydrogenase E1 component